MAVYSEPGIGASLVIKIMALIAPKLRPEHTK